MLVNPDVAYDVIRVGVQDTLVVQDIIVNLPKTDAPSFFGGVTIANVIGWAITVISAVTTALIAVAGWKRASKTAHEVQDMARAREASAERDVFMDALGESLYWYRVELPIIIRCVTDEKPVPPLVLDRIDAARALFDSNRERLGLIEDPIRRRLVARLFIRERMWRSTLAHSKEDRDTTMPPGLGQELYLDLWRKDADTLWEEFKFKDTHVLQGSARSLIVNARREQAAQHPDLDQ